MKGGICIKRLFLICMALLLTALTVLPAFAAEAGGGQVLAQPEQPLMAPVMLTENPGLMGCKLTVRYDPAVLTPQGVNRGSLTKDGLLEDSIAVAQPGSFDVVWTSSAQAEGDGTLCTLLFTPLQAKNTEITLDYSARDTFNEAFEDVALTLKPIAVTFNAAAAESAETLTQAQKEVDSADLVTAFEIITNGKPLTDLSGKPEEDLLAEFNTVLENLGSPQKYDDYETLWKDYTAAAQETYVDDVLQAVNGEEIRAVIAEALKDAGAETLDAVPQEKRPALVAQVEKALQAKVPDLPLIGDQIPTVDAYAALETLQAENETQIAAAIPVPALQEKPEAQKDNRAVWIVLGGAALLLVAGGITAAALHHKKKSKIEEELTE